LCAKPRARFGGPVDPIEVVQLDARAADRQIHAVGRFVELLQHRGSLAGAVLSRAPAAAAPPHGQSPPAARPRAAGVAGGVGHPAGAMLSRKRTEIYRSPQRRARRALAEKSPRPRVAVSAMRGRCNGVGSANGECGVLIFAARWQQCGR